MMNQKSFAIAAAAALLALACTLAGSLAQGPARTADAASGVLLLRNGQILSGEIVRSGDRYVVCVNGGRITVNASDVDMCCASLEEVYQHKRARLTLPEARQFLDLARWCQRQGLLRHAAEAIDQAERIEPDHPLIPLLRRGVELAGSPAAAAPSAGPVRPASFNTAELDQLVRDMPPGTVELFSETIQPLLVNRCATSACHGPGATTQFGLLRPSVGRPPSRRMTQRNLHAVLQWVDRQQPAASRLLTAPIRPHGSLESAVFNDQHSDQYQQLVDWVVRLAMPSEATGAPPDAAPTETPGPFEAVPAAHLSPTTASEGTPVAAPLSWADELNGLDLDLSDSPSDETLPGKPGLIDPEPSVQRGARLPIFVPRDPFDPEIFNRRFFTP